MNKQLNWNKMDNLIPAIVQDSESYQVLMLGYVNQEALAQTIATGKVTFYSRSKNKIWIKGETSGNFLSLVKVIPDCDNDALIILAKPNGPTCHRGEKSCFRGSETDNLSFLKKLEAIVEQRYQVRKENSYTSSLFDSGIKRIAQKVGEEGIETALAAAVETKEQFLNEAADLIYHLLVLLKARDSSLNDVVTILLQRYDKKCEAKSA